MTRTADYPDHWGIQSRLRELRKAKGLTLIQAAPLVALSVSHLSQIERGAAMPSIPALAGILDLYGLDLQLAFVPKETKR